MVHGSTYDYSTSPNHPVRPNISTTRTTAIPPTVLLYPSRLPQTYRARFAVRVGVRWTSRSSSSHLLSSSSGQSVILMLHIDPSELRLITSIAAVIYCFLSSCLGLRIRRSDVWEALFHRDTTRTPRYRLQQDQRRPYFYASRSEVVWDHDHRTSPESIEMVSSSAGQYQF